MVEIPDKYKDIFAKKAFAHLGTVMPDGSPQVSPVWFETVGNHFIINSEARRLKTRNMQRDPRVSLSISDPDNPYRYVEVRGKVVDISDKGGAEHLDKLASRYMGVDKYPYNQPGDVRLIFKIEPHRFTGMG